MRLHPGRKCPENIGRIEHIDIVVEDEDIFRMIERQCGSGGAPGIAFGHLFHRNENIVVRVAALLANRGDAGNGFAAAAQIGAFARQIHPRLVAFRRDDRLVHRAVAIINRLYFIVNTSRVALRPEITRRFTERTFDDSASRFQHAFDDDFGVGRDQQIVAESFRCDQAATVRRDIRR